MVGSRDARRSQNSSVARRTAPICAGWHTAKRTCDGLLTAVELDSILPDATTVVSREAFYNATSKATAEAVAGLTSDRARRIATRQAALKTLELFNLITVTRGDDAHPGPLE